MPRALRPFFLATACSWIGLFIAAFAYRKVADARWIWTAVLPAFLFETLFYVGSVMENTRTAFAARIRSQWGRAAVLWITTLPSCLLLLNLHALVLVAALTFVFAFWYAVLPHRFAYDAGFLVIAAAPVVLRVFGRLYPEPDHMHLDILGHLMWIRVGIIGLLVLRAWNPGPVSFWPVLREWKIGFLWFAAALLPVVLTASVTKDMQFAAPIWSWRVAAVVAGTFLGAMWVVALSEELFFRGFIERALLNNACFHPLLAVGISALLFGAVHLWFGHFPNYRRVLTVAVLGLFCGLAYLQSRSIRASMVTHACAIVTMRLFFR